MIASLKKRYAALCPDALVALWLGVWWVCNLVQAGCTELANDEAYYHMFAENLAWGYFDHPPMTALLVWLGEHLFGGELGVRFFFTLLQPLYLYILWRIIRPADADRRDATLFVMLSAATLMLQLYGFIAVPDGPLMMTTALFLLAFKWFSEQRRWAWLWMGVAMALMAYSKYHGALVVVFALAVNPRLLLRPGLYLSGAVALLLLVPHFIWQYEHGWASFAYHLSGRNSVFRPNYIAEYLLNLLVVFNPFFVPLYVKAWIAVKPKSAVGRAVKFLPVAFIGFFLLTTLRGYVQPQWVIVGTFGLLYTLFTYARRHPRTRRYLMRMGWVTIALIALVRVEMIFNPLGIRYEVFDNHTSYGEIAKIAGGRPVVFRHGYAVAAKYSFYTGAEAYCQPNIRYRTHQWQFRDDDTRFAGREVLIETPYDQTNTTGRVHSVVLPNGKRFTWFVDTDFRPTRLVDIEYSGLPERVSAGDTLRLELLISNPYPYDIDTFGDRSLVMLWKHGRFRIEEFDTEQRFGISAHGVTILNNVVFVVPEELAGADFDVGFALRREGYTNWFNGKPLRSEVVQ
ncbi:glycosyltransferase family 39 protein [uncultured Alistipes sp.]|uniref:ArnT family glycosyltransferase n=1 Tax=uncultured Alistipes sp. TaxID=538949 RepID=UPI0025E73A1F|nr:glycosyltransferase family 39 protein [uncultured Alistipes sp.]